MKEVSWEISAHAAQRLQERVGRPFDPTEYRPTKQGRDGLRLWCADDDSGLLVREDHGTGWTRYLVVTAYSSQYVVAGRERSRFKPMPYAEILDTQKVATAAERVATGTLSSEAQRLLALLQAIPKPRTTKQLAYALGYSLDTAGQAIGELRLAGLAKRHSRTKKTWVAVAQLSTCNTRPKP